MKGKSQLLSFNRGIVSRLALARLDLKRMEMSAAEQTNFMPRALGSMMLRPGLRYIGGVPSKAKMIPFIFARDDAAMVEMTAGAMRVWVGDAVLSRPNISATVTNGSFVSDLAGWVDQSESGGTSAWVAGGYMGLTGDGTAYAIRQQAASVGAAGMKYAIRVVVERGPVTLRVGSTSLGAEYLADTRLGTGAHSIVVEPTDTTLYIQFKSRANRQVLVDSVAIEPGGALSIPTPYSEADLALLRWDQSGDVIYLACEGHQQRKIERRANGSWSLVVYEPEDGPFRIENVTPTTISASALSGNITLAASASLFHEEHVGALFSITSVGQRVEASFTAENTFSDPIRVTGIGESRRFAVILSGTFTATVTLQRSVGEVGSWEDVTTYAAATSTTYNDALDNQIIYFRLGVKTGNYTSGTADAVLNYSSGSITGIARITGYTDDKTVSAEVLKALGGMAATDIWAEGQWSAHRGWPSSVALHDGRLWWAGKDRFNGSVTDAFESFDATVEGDAGPISRSIGSGPVDSINWLLSLNRLLAGTDGAEIACRSSSLDEPLTPTNFTPKAFGTQGTAAVAPVKVDGAGVFVQQNGTRLYEVGVHIQFGHYEERDLTVLAPEVTEPGVVTMAIQRQPDTRIHCVRSDGGVSVLIYDKAEDVKCWVEVETSGLVEDAVVLPGTTEDAVYYLVSRGINGSTERYLEKWALESEARGGEWNKQADSFVTAASGSAVLAPHLEGATVVAWGSGRDLGEFTVSGGYADLGENHTNICVGLPYEARFKSTKLAYLAEPGQSALGARKHINYLGLILADTHAQGIQYGQDFETMDPMPLMEKYAEVDGDTIHESYEETPFEFPGSWDTDARLCLKAQAPRPCTVLAAVIDMTSNVKA